MRTETKNILMGALLCFLFLSLPAAALANLASKYDSPASGGGGSAALAAVVTTPAKPAPAAGAVFAAAKPQNGEQVKTFNLPKKYLEAINKEHARFCKAAVDAEMGLRYFFKTGYDATRGKKAPNQEQIKAMRFEIQLLMKDLSSSAKRYARNVAFARAALENMTEEERTFFAIIFRHITASEIGRAHV